MSHLLVMARGEYTAPEVEAELWTVTQRFAVVNGAVDPVGTLPNLSAHSHETIVNTANAVGQTNFVLQGSGSDLDPVHWLENEIYTAWKTFMQSFVPMGSACNLSRLDCYLIGTNGKAQHVDGLGGTIAHAYIDLPEGTRPVGATGGDLLPLQCTVVVSWYTAITTRKGRGRSYIPGIASGQGRNGLLTPASQGTAAIAAAQFAQDTRATGYSGWNTALAVIGGPQWVDYAVSTSARVGRVVDTQRRRRNALNESYMSASISI